MSDFLRGDPADKDLRATPKKYGKKEVIGKIVEKNGKFEYVHVDGSEFDRHKKLDLGKTIRVNWIGGCEHSG